jgi:hypothetical protein
MAGFAVDIGDAGAAFEQGVTAPSTTETAAAAQGLNMLGKGVFGLLDGYAAATKQKAPTEASVNREAFATLSQSIQGTKGMSPLQQRTAVNSALASHFAQGGEVGEAESKMIKMTTGIDVNYLNANPQQDAINSTVEELQKNPAYLYQAEANLRATGQPFTQEDVYTNAMAAVQKNEAAALYLVNSKNTTESEFLQTFVPHANSMLGDIRSLAFAALKIETEGGNVRPERLVQLQAELTKVKAILAKPALVSAEAYQGIQAQVETLEGLMTTIMSYDEGVLTQEKADILEPITKALMDQARQIGETDPVLASVLLSGDTQFLSTYAAQKYPEVMKTLNNMEVEDTVYKSLEGTGDSTALDPDEVPSLHNEEEITLATDRDVKGRNDAISFATNQRVRLSTIEGMNDPKHRDNFLAGIGQATVNIATSPVLIQQGTLDEVLHDSVFAKLKAIDKLDPEAATLARNQLKDAVEAQANIFATTMKGTFEGSLFKVTGVGRVEINTDGVQMPRAWTEGLVQKKADQYYDGNIYNMFKDRGKQLSASEQTELRGKGFSVTAISTKYAEITRYNDKYKSYIGYFRKLGGDTKAIEALVLDRQEQVKPLVGNNADNPMQIVWSDDTDTDEKLFATLEDGQYFTGPDGNVYVKGEQLNGQ